MSALFRLLTLTLVGAFLLAWVALCGAVFWFLYSGITASSPDRAVELLNGITWPFTVILIGIPLVMLMAFGGLRAIRELVELQKMVATFPRDIEAMRDAVQVFRAIKDDLVATRAELGIVSSEISQAQTSSAGSSTESQATGDEQSEPSYVSRFEALYADAKKRFRQAVRNYVRENPNDASFNSGDDWIEIIKKLRDARGGYFDPGPNKDRWVADWLIKMIETERKTRRNRAGRLSEAEVKQLEEEAPRG